MQANLEFSSKCRLPKGLYARKLVVVLKVLRHFSVLGVFAQRNEEPLTAERSGEALHAEDFFDKLGLKNLFGCSDMICPVKAKKQDIVAVLGGNVDIM